MNPCLRLRQKRNQLQLQPQLQLQLQLQLQQQLHPQQQQQFHLIPSSVRFDKSTATTTPQSPISNLQSASRAKHSSAGFGEIGDWKGSGQRNFENQDSQFPQGGRIRPLHSAQDDRHEGREDSQAAIGRPHYTLNNDNFSGGQWPPLRSNGNRVR